MRHPCARPDLQPLRMQDRRTWHGSRRPVLLLRSLRATLRRARLEGSELAREARLALERQVLAAVPDDRDSGRAPAGGTFVGVAPIGIAAKAQIGRQHA